MPGRDRRGGDDGERGGVGVRWRRTRRRTGGVGGNQGGPVMGTASGAERETTGLTGEGTRAGTAGEAGDGA